MCIFFGEFFGNRIWYLKTRVSQREEEGGRETQSQRDRDLQRQKIGRQRDKRQREGYGGGMC